MNKNCFAVGCVRNLVQQLNLLVVVTNVLGLKGGAQRENKVRTISSSNRGEAIGKLLARLFTVRTIIAGRIKIIIIGRLVEPKKKGAYWPAPSLGEVSNPFFWSVVPWLIRPLWSHWVGVRYQKMYRMVFFLFFVHSQDTPTCHRHRQLEKLNRNVSI